MVDAARNSDKPLNELFSRHNIRSLQRKVMETNAYRQFYNSHSAQEIESTVAQNGQAMSDLRYNVSQGLKQARQSVNNGNQNLQAEHKNENQKNNIIHHH